MTKQTGAQALQAHREAMVRAMTTDQLCAVWAATEGTITHDPHLAIVRGWIMDELERRDPIAFDRWIDSYNDLPSIHYLTA